MSTANQERNDQRFDALEASFKNMEKTMGQIAGSLQRHEKGKLPAQPEQAQAVELLDSKSQATFKVNGHRVKPYLERVEVRTLEECTNVHDVSY